MQTVYVLGAGASRFGGFPLAKDLLPFLRVEYENTGCYLVPDLRYVCKRALDFVDDVKGIVPKTRLLKNGEPDLEFVLSLNDRINQNADVIDPRNSHLVEELDSVIEKLQLRTIDLSPVWQGVLMLATSAFQHQSLLLNDSRRPSNNNLARISDAWVNLLGAGDTLVTFNWDLVQEIFLWKSKKWFYQDGYGIKTLLSENSSSTASQVTLLKLHGSCNWALRHAGDASLYIDDVHINFDAIADELRHLRPLGSTSYYGPSLIVPSYLKDPWRITILRSLWKKAAEKIITARELVVLGYSLPEGDLFAQRLFQSALEQNKSLTSIIIVLGEDDVGYEHWEAICKYAKKNCSKVRKTFEEYITAPC